MTALSGKDSRALALVRIFVVLGLAGATLAGCAADKSYAVVTVATAQGEMTGIAQFVVYVTAGTTRSTLYYPQSPNTDPAGYRLTPTESIDFSVSYETSFAGLLRIGVEPRDRLSGPLGYGASEKTIDPGHRIDLSVAVVQGALAPPVGSEPDGGVPQGDAADDGGVTGCNPLSPVAACGVGKTCTVSCTTPPVGVCATAGMGKDGDLCTSNRDCEPGSQCFTYGCGRVCRKFCSADAECPAGSCDRTVSCGAQPTSHRFCSQACDPRSSAVATCKGNFRCLLFANEKAACDCADAARVGGDGVACQTTANCMPGLMCVMMGTPQPVCRPICKLSEGDCAAGRLCTELVEPRYLVWGACVPSS